jgi:hypothetical protein
MNFIRSIALLALVSGCDNPQAAGNTSPPADARPEGVALCYTTLADQLPATQGFWAALRGADYSARPGALAALDSAAQKYGKEEEVALLDGLGNLWRVAEPTSAEAQDMTGFLLAALNAKTQLQNAFDLCPTDYRIAAWLGPVLVNMGRQLNDSSTINQGLTVLETGIEHYPSFVLFSKLLVYADQPASSPDFQEALQAVDANIGACGDLRTTRDPACRNSEHAAHNVEGGAVFLGDVYAKAGRKADALAAYQGAQKSPDFAQWAFQSLLEDRMSTLDARVAAFASGSRTPESAWNSKMQCVLCHQR